MAEKTLNTRVLLRYDLYENWTTNNPVLKAGEMAIATITSGDTQEVNSVLAPQVLIKVGDGTSNYNALPFVSAKSADVYGWAKAAVKPEYQASEIKNLDTFINTTIQDTDTQYKIVKVTDYQYKLMSKIKAEADYTTEVAVIDIPNDTEAITRLNGLVGDTAVATQITNALATYATTAQMTAAIATAKGEATKHADDLNTAMNTRVEALEAIDHEHSFVESELNKIADGDVAKWNAAEQNAKDFATGLNTAMDGRVADLEAMFGDGEGTVEAQIEAAVAAEKQRAEGIEGGLRTDVDAIKADYLKAADKTALQEQITTNAGNITKLNGLVGDKAVATQISEAVEAEAEIARAAEKANADAIKAISDDYLKAADKTELTNAIATAKSEAIATVLGQGVDEDFDTLKEVADWILSDTTGAAALQKDVADIKKDYLTSADKTEVEGKITALANGAVKANTEAIETLNGTGTGSVAKKIADAIAAENLAQYATDEDLEDATDRIATIESDLNAETTGLKAKVAAISGLVGDKAVATQISEAVAAEAEIARAAEKANADDIDTLEGKVATLEGKAHEHANEDVLEGIEAADVAAWDAKIDAVTGVANGGIKATKTGNNVALELDDTITYIFNCGDSTILV